MTRPVPLVGFVAWSGTGKTTLIEALLPLLRARALRVGAVKHAHHAFDPDLPGKDSHRLRHAGAERVLVASAKRYALMVETPDDGEPALDRCLQALGTRTLDLVLVEGFKHERFPKIELHRPALGKPLMFPDDDSIVAVATDAPLARRTTLPLLDLNDPAAIAEHLHDNVVAVPAAITRGPRPGP